MTTGILRRKVIAKWGEHLDKAFASIRQGKNAKFVKYVFSVWNGRKEPVEVLLVDALRKEGDDSEKLPGD